MSAVFWPPLAFTVLLRSHQARFRQSPGCYRPSAQRPELLLLEAAHNDNAEKTANKTETPQKESLITTASKYNGRMQAKFCPGVLRKALQCPQEGQSAGSFFFLLRGGARYLRVQCTLEWYFFQPVLDRCGGSILQQRLYDALVTPACSNVQGCVPFLVADVQSAGLDIIVDQSLHTLQRHSKVTVSNMKASGNVSAPLRPGPRPPTQNTKTSSHNPRVPHSLIKTPHAFLSKEPNWVRGRVPV